MVKQLYINVETGEKIWVEVDEATNGLSLEELAQDKREYLFVSYAEALKKGFTSSTTGEPIHYGYTEIDQLNYSKLANLFSLNPSKVSTYLGTISHGVLVLTREQFIALMDDAEQFEMNLYLERKNLESLINNATTVEELNSIVIDFS